MTRRKLLLSSLGFTLFPTVSPQEPTGNKWALLIGIDAYQGKVAPLVGAVADAQGLGKALIEAAGFPKENVTVLTTQNELKPTKGEIVDQLDALAGKVKKGDVVFVFFAGHGCQDDEANKTYLLPMDARATSGRVLRDTALSTEQFTEYLRRLPARLLLLTFDMCRVELGRSGAEVITKDLQTRGLSFATAKYTEADAELPQVVVTWWSCTPKERAYEMTRERRGYFSAIAEEVLREQSKRGPVSVGSWLSAVNPRVTSEVRRREGRTQTPRFDPKGLRTLGELNLLLLSGSDSTKPLVSASLEKKTLSGSRGKLRSAAAEARSKKCPHLALYLEELCEIPAGSFTRGSDSDDEKPKGAVSLSTYFMGKTEVTVALWQEYAQAKLDGKMPPELNFNPGWSKTDHPIVNVSWDDIMGVSTKGGFCTWASEVSGIPLTLPSEAQWEKAARGVDNREYPWGNVFDPSKLWTSKSTPGDAGGTARVGSFPAGSSPYGCLDMAGSVWEWCLDFYADDFYSVSQKNSDNPVNLNHGKRDLKVLRGGSWYSFSEKDFRTADRVGFHPSIQSYYGGFRISYTEP